MRFGIAVCVIDAENIHRIWNVFALVGSFLGANSLDKTFSTICVCVVADPIKPDAYEICCLEHVQAPCDENLSSVARIPFLVAVTEAAVDEHGANAGWIRIGVSSTLLLLAAS